MTNVYLKSRVYVSLYYTLIDWLNYEVWDLVIESCIPGETGMGMYIFHPHKFTHFNLYPFGSQITHDQIGSCVRVTYLNETSKELVIVHTNPIFFINTRINCH